MEIDWEGIIMEIDWGNIIAAVIGAVSGFAVALILMVRSKLGPKH